MSSAAPAPPVRRVRVMSSGHWHQPVVERRARQVIAVASAQPNAGKSVVAANLAAALAGLGQKVVLVDLDLQTPCQHALLGVRSKPRPFDVWLDERRQTRDATPVATHVRNLRVLPYAGWATGDAEDRRAAAEALHELEADVVVVDLGAANRDDLFDFFATRALRLLVSPRDRPALEATYGFLTSAARRAAERYGERSRAALAQFSGGLVGNWIAAPEEAETFHAFSRLVRAHLGIPLPVIGCLRGSDRIPQSIAARQPLVARRGLDDNVRTFHQMAEWVVAGAAAAGRECDLAGGEGPSLASAPLPEELSSYERKHPRLPVDWTATLELPRGATAIRVRDVSASGAGVETLLALRVGDEGVLHLDQLEGQPPLQVIVKNVLPSLKRVGLGFVEAGDATDRLLAAAAKARSRS